jgi:hypothetical protein
VELTQLHLHPTVRFFTRKNNIISSGKYVTYGITIWKDVFPRGLISPLSVLGITLQANLSYL